MATVSDISRRVRTELGDTLETFRAPIRGDGVQQDFPLPDRNISSTSVEVFKIHEDMTTEDLVLTTDYTINYDDGDIHFVVAPAPDETVIVSGSSFGIFSDTEIMTFITDALVQHCMDRTATKHYRDSHGFIQYDRVPMDLSNMPDQEAPLVAMLATIHGLWALATDASTDINVQTSEGTSIPRGQRHQQLLSQIAALTDWYERLSLTMGVGIFAPEVFTMRRVSRQTGRLVPVFRDREYDENGPPVRVIPPIGNRDADPDGPASPWWPSPMGY